MKRRYFPLQRRHHLLITILLAVTLCVGLFLFSYRSKTQAATPPIKTVFLIMMESYPWSTVSTYPYIGGTLTKIGGYATAYTKPAGTGDNLLSLPEYIWLEAGDNLGIVTDDDPALVSQSTTLHLATQLNNVGISWREYAENISGTDCPINDQGNAPTGNYAVRHNPFVYFQDSTNNNSSTSAYCIAHNRPYSELATDLANNTVARYNFITPNTCDDMHDSCTKRKDPVAQGDTWLSQQIPMIMNSAAYKNGGAIFITWDNDDYSATAPIGMIILSPYIKSPGYHNSIAYDHSSTLKTMQEIFGVPLIRAAANTSTNDLFDFFTTTGATPTPVSTTTPAATPVDTTPPTVSIVAPLNNSTVTKGSSVTISANATDDVAISHVDFYINGSILSNCVIQIAPYNCLWSVPPAKSKIYDITAKAYDTSNNTSSSSITVTAQ